LQCGVDAALAINAYNGALTPIACSPFATGTRPVPVAIDPLDRFAYVGNLDSKNLSAYRISENVIAPGVNTGVLTTVSGSPFATGTMPYSATVDGSARFLYVANSTANTVSAWLISPATGGLTPLSGSPYAAGANPLSIVTTTKLE
jgi:6-phosphogluconolactonase (cycloisomerase 2 family)